MISFRKKAYDGYRLSFLSVTNEKTLGINTIFFYVICVTAQAYNFFYNHKKNQQNAWVRLKSTHIQCQYYFQGNIIKIMGRYLSIIQVTDICRE